MRDIVRDAAIVTMAKAHKKVGTDVDQFLKLYEDPDSALPEYVKDLLIDLDMINQTWANWDIWNSDAQMFRDGQYIWIWSK